MEPMSVNGRLLLCIFMKGEWRGTHTRIAVIKTLKSQLPTQPKNNADASSDIVCSAQKPFDDQTSYCIVR